MKLGILTFHSVDNYGAVLQAFALQTFLSSQGHNVEIIDYRPAYFHTPSRISLRPDRFVGAFVNRFLSSRFERFRRRYMNRTATCLSAEELERNLPRYDCLIVGSDQVWSPSVDRRKRTDAIYFFRWKLPAETKKIAYAASFGTDEIPHEHRADVAEGLKNVDIFSVRERSGVKIVQELVGRDATWVCDPVFLLTPEQWLSAANVTRKTFKSLFTYMGPSYKAVCEVARGMKTQICASGWIPRYLLTPGLGLCFPNPLGWIRRIAQSRGVITMSFHGTAVCILMHTPFVYVQPSGAGACRATRVLSILRRLHLEDRIIREDEVNSASVTRILTNPVDWRAVDRYRESYRNESIAFILSSLVSR